MLTNHIVPQPNVISLKSPRGFISSIILRHY